MGEVYRARDPKLNRDVALKVLADSLSADRDLLARFEREAKAVAALSHPNVLSIYDYGVDDGRAYAVTELLEGQTLRERLSHGPLPLPRAIDLASQIAKGLAAAHAKGIVHRDLKPENVFITHDGHLKILDFGLARQLPPADLDNVETVLGNAVTHPGSVLGTPGYMSPEQVHGKPVDERSDMFSFGCVLYEMLSGRRAFQGESAVDTLHAILRTEPIDLATLVNAPPQLVRIVSRCLEKKPADRFQSARDLAFALEALTSPAGSGVRDVAAEPSRPRRWRPLVLAGAALAVIAVAIWGALRPRNAPDTPATDAARGIAVLPFENIGESRDAYFASGVTEEVTSQLSQIKSLRVMSRSAVARFPKGAAELPEMTRQLGVAAVVTGTVRHAAGRVRVGVQLVSAPQGETLWADQYDREIKDIFGVQTDVAVRVAEALRTALTPQERRRLERPPTTNAAANEMYLRQRPLSLGVPKQNTEGIALLKEAVALDPRFALAHSALAGRYAWAGAHTGREDLERGVEAARTALSIDSQLARAHRALALNLMALGRVEEARLSMQRAIEFDPSMQAALNDLSILEVNAHRFDQSLYWARRAFPLAPNLANSYYHVGAPLVFLDEAVAERYLLAAESRFPADPGAIRVQMLLAIAHYGRGQTDAAVARLRRAVAGNPDYADAVVVLTEMAALTGTQDAEQLVDTLFKQSPNVRGWVAPHTARTWRAYFWMKAGQRQQALPMVQEGLEANRQAWDAGDRSPGLPLENVALHLMRGDEAAAREWLDRADQAGWTDHTVARDPLLAPLHKDPRFLAFIERINEDRNAMRQRADMSGLADR